MFISNQFFVTLVSFFAVALAAPTELENRSTDAAVTITVCTAVGFGGTCVAIPAVSDACTNFNGGLTILNKELSSAVVPGGLICTFFEDFGCLSAGSSQSDEVALQGGSYANFGQIAGIWGSQSFNDLTSSISCSPL